MKSEGYRQLFNPDQLINGYEDASNNFARGFYNSGQLIKAVCYQQIRREVERSDNLQTFHVYRSLGGGTGSGMTAVVFELLSEYSKITKLEIPIHPSPHLSSATVEPYNCILGEHFCMDDIDMSLLMDNEALYDIMSQNVSVANPTLYDLNRILAQVCSSISSSARFPNDLYNDFTIMTNLVPYPRIHFPLISYAPFGCTSKQNREVQSVFEITKAVFWSENQMVKCDPSIGKFMSCSLLYRGKISPADVYDALAEIKSGHRVNFVDWCPTGFKVGIVNRPPQILSETQVGISPINVIMMTNNSSVSTVWHRLSQKFHSLYSKRSFVHWFVAEGLEENEFCESLYNIATLAKDYEEVALDTKCVKNYVEDNSDDIEFKHPPKKSDNQIKGSPESLNENKAIKTKVDGKVKKITQPSKVFEKNYASKENQGKNEKVVEEKSEEQDEKEKDKDIKNHREQKSEEGDEEQKSAQTEEEEKSEKEGEASKSDKINDEEKLEHEEEEKKSESQSEEGISDKIDEEEKSEQNEEKEVKSVKKDDEGISHKTYETEKSEENEADRLEEKVDNAVSNDTDEDDENANNDLNFSNAMSFNSQYVSKKSIDSHVYASHIKTLTKAYRLSCEKEKNNLSFKIHVNNEVVDNINSNNSSRAVFNSKFYKRRFIKTCNRTRHLDEEESVQSLMNKLIRITNDM